MSRLKITPKNTKRKLSEAIDTRRRHSLLPSNSRIDGFTSARLATMSRELDPPLVLPNTLPAALSFLWWLLPPFLEEDEDVFGSNTSGTSMQSYCLAKRYAAD